MKFTGISFLLSALAASTAHAWIEPYPVQCRDVAPQQQVCASYYQYGPTIDFVDGEYKKVGGYGYLYQYQGEKYSDLGVEVKWVEPDDTACTAIVHGQTCRSCHRCDTSSNNPVTVDCSNVDTPFGKGRAITTCEPLHDNVFFPLQTSNDSTSTGDRYCYETKAELQADIDAYVRHLKSPQTHAFDVEKKGKIGEWCVSKITDFSLLFEYLEDFNEDLSQWDTSDAVSMRGMFRGATVFNQDLSSWNVGKVKEMSRMFESAKAFDQDLSAWDTGSVETTKLMFRYATEFNGDVSTWDTSNLRDMSGMFQHAHEFNGYLNSWDVSRVTTLDGTFAYAYKFNQALDLWDTSSVTNMKAVFASAHSFDQPLADWETHKVTSFRVMFRGANSFNQPLADWSVSAVTDLRQMFEKATSFDQNLCAWEDALDVGMTPAVEKMFGQTDCPVQADPVLGSAARSHLCHACASS